MTDTKPTYAPGELVDITIHGARVRGYYGAAGAFNDGEPTDLMVTYGAADLNLDLGAEGVTVERMAPAEWPPRYKQIWQDSNGDLWTLARDVTVGAERPYTRHNLVCADRSREVGIYGVADLLERYGPLELVFDAAPADTEDGES